MNNWKKCKLGDIAEILNNKRIPLNTMQRQKMQGKYPYYGASGIIDYVNDYLFDGEYVLISEDGENLKSRKTPIAFKASGKFWVNNHAHIIKGKMDFQNDLIVYIFKNIDLNPYLTGAVQPKLNKENLLDIDFYLPPLEEQRQIAAILSSIDDKIELLHEQNKTLEELAQALFRHYFIENPNPSWQEKPLKDVCVILNGYAFKSKEYSQNGTKIVRTINFKNGFIDNKDVIYIDNLENQYDKYLLRKNDFLLVMVGASLGNYVVVTSNFLPALQNQNMWNFRALEGVSQHYLNYALRDIVKESVYGASGSAREFFQKNQFYEKNILVPSFEIMNKFEEEISGFYDKLNENLEQIQTLENMRDILIPKLLNGEIKINK